MKKLPDYLFTRKFLLPTVAFITVFSVIFLAVYTPFSATSWLTLKEGYLRTGTLSFYTVSVLFLIASKLLYIEFTDRKHPGFGGVLVYYLFEMLVISVFYIAATALVRHDGRSAWTLFPKSFICVMLIMSIPYALSFMFGYAKGLKMEMGQADAGSAGNRLVSIHDSKGKIRLSLMSCDLFYAQSEDNYVKLFYSQGGGLKSTMIRTSSKSIEEDLDGVMVRCHRSYLINPAKVSFFNNDRDNLYVQLNDSAISPIPVSRSYRGALELLLSKQ